MHTHTHRDQTVQHSYHWELERDTQLKCVFHVYFITPLHCEHERIHLCFVSGECCFFSFFLYFCFMHVMKTPSVCISVCKSVDDGSCKIAYSLKWNILCIYGIFFQYSAMSFFFINSCMCNSLKWVMSADFITEWRKKMNASELIVFCVPALPIEILCNLIHVKSHGFFL